MSFFIRQLPITQIKIFLAKALYRLTKIFYKNNIRKIQREGIFYEVDLSEGIELSLFLFGNFQKHVTNSKLLRIPSNGVIFDVGANVGIMSLQFAKMVPDGKVYSFEPTHYAYNRFIKNLSLNPELSKRITPTQTFISAETKQNANIKAFSSWKVDGTTGDMMHPLHLGTAKSTEGVPSITLNDFCTHHQITRIDFIKIDTDGHEFEILKGCKEVIKRYRPKIILEIGIYVMTEKGIDFSFYSEYFGSLNYKLLNSKTGKEITFNNHQIHIPLKGTIDMFAFPL